MGDVDRFGPLRSVTSYSCVLVDLCVKEYREFESEREFRLSNPSPFFLSPFFLGLGLLFIWSGVTTWASSCLRKENAFYKED